MAASSKSKVTKKAKTRTARKPASSSRKRPRKEARPARPGQRKRPAAPRKAPSHYEWAIGGLRQATATMSPDELLAIIAALPWPGKARWLSSYLAESGAEAADADNEAVAKVVEDFASQVAALLDQMEAEEPTEYLHAVTCLFSAEPEHADAGAAWLAENTGQAGIDLEELEELPGYRLFAELLDLVEDEDSET